MKDLILIYINERISYLEDIVGYDSTEKNEGALEEMETLRDKINNIRL